MLAIHAWLVNMKVAVFFLLFCAKDLWSFKMMDRAETNTNDEEKFKDYFDSITDTGSEKGAGNGDTNLLQFLASVENKEEKKRRDAVIGTEYWGKKKRNSRNDCKRLVYDIMTMEIEINI